MLSFSGVGSTGSSRGTRTNSFSLFSFHTYVTHNCIAHHYVIILDIILSISNKKPSSTSVTIEGLALPSAHSTD